MNWSKNGSKLDMLSKIKQKNNCGLCNSINLKQIINLGNIPLAGLYLKKEEIDTEKYYPLALNLCLKCGCVQVSHIISPEILYKDYRYLSSVPLSEHFKQYAEEMNSRFLTKDSFIVEIGSNDGVLLKPLKNMGFNVLGVDPAINIAKKAIGKGVDTITNYFTPRLARRIVENKQQSDAIFANNVLAHIEHLDKVFEGIKILLKEDGFGVFEVNYLVDLVEKVQYDIIYHEHHYYHTVTALFPFLDRFGFEIFDVKRIPTHFGSIRVYFKNKGINKYRNTDSLKKLSDMEKKMGLFFPDTYKNFMERVIEKKDKLIKKILEIKNEYKTVVGYGASVRANILLNFCGITILMLDYIVDESPERYGRYTPGTHIPIYPPSKFREEYPDYALLLAFSYKDMIMEKEKEFIKQGGEFIMPI